MVNFYSDFIQCDPSKNATLQDVLRNWCFEIKIKLLVLVWPVCIFLTEHIEYIRGITGPDHLGIGADFDGVSRTPQGLEDVSKYPDLIEALIRTGNWSADDLEKLSGRNLLRVFRDVERVSTKFIY